MGSSHSEKCSKCEAKPTGCKSEHPGADSIFTLNIFPRGNRCLKFAMMQRPRNCLIKFSAKVSASHHSVTVWLMNSSCPSLSSFTINATFDSVSHRAPSIRFPRCHRISKLDYLEIDFSAFINLYTLPLNRPNRINGDLVLTWKVVGLGMQVLGVGGGTASLWRDFDQPPQ